MQIMYLYCCIRCPWDLIAKIAVNGKLDANHDDANQEATRSTEDRNVSGTVGNVNSEHGGVPIHHGKGGDVTLKPKPYLQICEIG